MATVEKIEEKLLNLINQENPFAIALTGEWGIGKTHFWKSFYEKNHNKFKTNKYSYISLFGIDSLESFKYQIAINTHDTNKKTDNLLSIKKLFSHIKDKITFPKIEVKGFTLAVTQTMINSIISNLIEDTIICIDDFERKSDKLDAREIMGLINFLKEEKKCKIIMILHEKKSKESEIFEEYKEKVFDDILNMDNNLSIIKSIIKNNEVIEIYEKFYTTIKIKNLRFYMKVNKDYQSITILNKKLSITSKKRILENILIIRMITEFKNIELKTSKGESFYANKDFLLNLDTIKDAEKIIAFNNHLNNFTNFHGLNDWGKLILENLMQYEVNHKILEKLIEEDLISEEKIQEDNELNEIFYECHNLKAKPKFIERLYNIAVKRSKKMNIDYAYFFYKLIKYVDPQKAQNLKKEIKNNIDNYLKQNINQELLFKKEGDDIFFKFAENKKEEYKKTHNLENEINLENIINLLIKSFKDSDINPNINLDFKSKEELRKVIWVDLDNKIYYRKYFIVYILNPKFYQDKHKRKKIRQWIVEILREEVNNNTDSKAPIEMWLNDTNELENLEYN